MRIHCKEKPPFKKDSVVTFGVTAGTQRLSVEGLIVWIRRASWCSSEYELGVQFRDQRPAIRAALAAMAQYGFVNPGSVPPAPPNSTGASPVGMTVEVEDLYAIMGIPASATDDQIRTAFRALARELHPDVCRDDAAQDKFTQVSKAYAVLRNPDSRKRYDELVLRLRAA